MKTQILRDTLTILEEGSLDQSVAQIAHLERELQEPWDVLTLKTVQLCIALLKDDIDYPDPE